MTTALLSYTTSGDTTPASPRARAVQKPAKQSVAAEAKPRTRAPTFANCANKYIESHQAGWNNAKQIDQWESTLRTYAGPVIGRKHGQAHVGAT